MSSDKHPDSSALALPQNPIEEQQEIRMNSILNKYFDAQKRGFSQHIMVFNNTRESSKTWHYIKDLPQNPNPPIDLNYLKDVQAFVFKSRFQALWILLYLESRQIKYDKNEAPITFNLVYQWIHEFFLNQSQQFNAGAFKDFFKDQLDEKQWAVQDLCVDYNIPPIEREKLVQFWKEHIKTDPPALKDYEKKVKRDDNLYTWFEAENGFTEVPYLEKSTTSINNTVTVSYQLITFQNDKVTFVSFCNELDKYYQQTIQPTQTIATRCWDQFAQGESLLLFLTHSQPDLYLSYPAVCVGSVNIDLPLTSQDQLKLKEYIEKLNAFVDEIEGAKAPLDAPPLNVYVENTFKNAAEIQEFFAFIKQHIGENNLSHLNSEDALKLQQSVQFPDPEKTSFYQATTGLSECIEKLQKNHDVSLYLQALHLEYKISKAKDEDEAWNAQVDFNSRAIKHVQEYQNPEEFFNTLYDQWADKNKIQEEKNLARHFSFHWKMTRNLVLIWVLAWDPECALRFFQGNTDALDDYRKQFTGYWNARIRQALNNATSQNSWFSRHKNTLIGFILGLIFAGSAIGLALSQHYKWSDFGDKKDLPFKIIFFILVGLAVIAWVSSAYLFLPPQTPPDVTTNLFSK